MARFAHGPPCTPPTSLVVGTAESFNVAGGDRGEEDDNRKVVVRFREPRDYPEMSFVVRCLRDNLSYCAI